MEKTHLKSSFLPKSYILSMPSFYIQTINANKYKTIIKQGVDIKIFTKTCVESSHTERNSYKEEPSLVLTFQFWYQLSNRKKLGKSKAPINFEKWTKLALCNKKKHENEKTADLYLTVGLPAWFILAVCGAVTNFCIGKLKIWELES